MIQAIYQYILFVPGIIMETSFDFFKCSVGPLYCPASGPVSAAFHSETWDLAANGHIFLLTMIFLGVADIVLCAKIRVAKKARWYFLHAIGNLLVMVVSTAAVYTSITRPLETVSDKALVRFDASTTVACTLHLYHVLFFKCSFSDWFHHLSFVGAGSIGQGLWGGYIGKLAAVYHFFVTGLPGMIDYFMLAGVEQGWVSKGQRIVVAVWQNTWLRAPGLVYAFTLIFVKVDNRSIWGCICMAFLAIFNGQYYMQQVLLTAGRKYDVKGS